MEAYLSEAITSFSSSGSSAQRPLQDDFLAQKQNETFSFLAMYHFGESVLARDTTRIWGDRNPKMW